MRKIQSESGIALVVALTVLIVLMLLTGVVLSATLNVSGASNRDTRSKRAFEAAQAGLQATLYRLNMNINSASGAVATLNAECIGGEAEEVMSPTSGNTCPEYKTELSSGVFYRSWTTTVFEGVGICAGVAVGASNSVAERCITAEGILNQGGQIVKQRVQERVASFDGKPQFSHAGVTGEKGVLIANQAAIKGPIYTNGTLEVQNQATALGYALGPGHPVPDPLAAGGASVSQLGAELLPKIENWEAAGRIPPVQASYTGSVSLSNIVYTSEGDARISNAFISCILPSCNPAEHPADKFTKDNNGQACSAGACGWNPQTRTLTLPSGFTWELNEGTYNLCSLILNGTARLAQGAKAVIYIDSPQDTSSNPPCPAASGYFQIGNTGSFVNSSKGLECSPQPCTPLTHDTTALQIDVFGPSNVPASTIYNNACHPTNSTCVSIGGQGEFWGTVFAPFSDVAVLNPGLSAGAIVGSTVTFNNKGTFTQDRNVTKVITSAALGTYYRTAWHQCSSDAPTTAPMSNC